MKISKIISVTQNGKAWADQPEWDCQVEMEDGSVKRVHRLVQWNRPEIGHLQDEMDRFPAIFETN